MLKTKPTIKTSFSINSRSKSPITRSASPFSKRSQKVSLVNPTILGAAIDPSIPNVVEEQPKRTAKWDIPGDANGAGQPGNCYFM